MVTPHLPWKFHANRSSRFSRNVADKETKKLLDYNTPSPGPTGGGVIKMVNFQQGKPFGRNNNSAKSCVNENNLFDTRSNTFIECSMHSSELGSSRVNSVATNPHLSTGHRTCDIVVCSKSRSPTLSHLICDRRIHPTWTSWLMCGWSILQVYATWNATINELKCSLVCELGELDQACMTSHGGHWTNYINVLDHGLNKLLCLIL